MDSAHAIRRQFMDSTDAFSKNLKAPKAFFGCSATCPSPRADSSKRISYRIPLIVMMIGGWSTSVASLTLEEFCSYDSVGVGMLECFIGALDINRISLVICLCRLTAAEFTPEFNSQIKYHTLIGSLGSTVTYFADIHSLVPRSQFIFKRVLGATNPPWCHFIQRRHRNAVKALWVTTAYVYRI